MKRFACAAVGLLALAGCQSPKSPSEACRQDAAWRQAARQLNGHQSATADAIESMRCDEIEREERRDARADASRRAAATEQAAAEDEASRAKRDAELAGIRRSPHVPELGATPPEGRVLCQRQRGDYVDRTAGGGAAAVRGFACRAQGTPIFECPSVPTFVRERPLRD